MFDKEKSWILNHEKILIVLAALVVLVYLGGRYFDSDSAVAKNAVAQQVLQEQVTQNATIAKQLAVQVQQYQEMITSLAVQNSSLARAMGQRQTEVLHQQKIDQTLPLPDLAVRWQKLAGLQPGDFENTPKGLHVSESGSRTTVQILETVPVLREDLATTHQIIANKNTQIEGATGVITGLNTQVAGLKTELTAKDKACETELKLAKAKARKGKVRSFIFGVGIGAGVVAKLVLF
jgi:hypothetical protein